MPCACSWSPLNAEMLMGVFWMVETYRSAVTVISSRPDSSLAVVAAAASVAAGDAQVIPARQALPTRPPNHLSDRIIHPLVEIIEWT